jgi:16S rRNA G966 N2-methylase RsmD
MFKPQLSLIDVQSTFVSFRPIHYLGSKLRLLGRIKGAIDAVAPEGLLCDLFAGSGVVSRALAATRPVIAVDIQEYSRVLCAALLSADQATERRHALAARAQAGDLLRRLTHALEGLLKYEEEAVVEARHGDSTKLWSLVEHGSLARAAAAVPGISEPLCTLLAAAITRLKDEDLWANPDAVVSRHFGGPFFSFRQATALDALLGAAHGASPADRDSALAPLLSTASSVVNTIGKQFAQPLKPRTASGHLKTHLLRRALDDRRMSVWTTYHNWVNRYAELPPSAGGSGAVRADYRDFLKQYAEPVAVFYADPPYTRDHYSRYYHVLETMCLRDQPTLSTTRIRTGGESQPSRGVYRADRHQSPFSIKSQAPSAFGALFEGVRRQRAALVLSYSPSRSAGAGEHGGAGRCRVLSVAAIVELARRHFGDVQVAGARGLRHSKLNRRGLSTGAVAEAEVLITCLP